MSDIYTTIRPTLYASAILGLAPFVVDAPAKSIRFSIPGAVYGIVLLVLFLATSIYSLYDRIGGSTASLTNIGEYTYFVLQACGIAATTCVIVLSIVQSRKVIRMIRNVHAVDSLLSRLDVRVPYDRVARRSCFALSTLAALLLLLLGHDLFISGTFGLPFWITYFVPVVYCALMEFQFISGGLLLRLDFALLNDRLARFAADELDADRKKLELVAAGRDGYFESHLTCKSPARAWHAELSRYRIRKIVPRDSLISPPLSPLAKVKIVRRIHSDLCEVKDLLNSSFSLQLLVVVAQAFVIITTNLYSLFTSTGSALVFISYPIVWAFFRTVELICVTVTCSRISKTANHTAVIVHKLLSQDWDSTVRSQLKLFSIQLLHRKMSFSACGFFTLDMTLLHAIIGAATTYLVILIQFHNTYEST